MKIPHTLIKSVSSGLILALIALLILFVLPISDNFFFQTKFYTFIFGTLLIAALFALYSLRKGSLEVVLSPFAGALTGFGGAMIASTFFTRDYPVEALVGMGGVYLAGVLLVFFSGTVVNQATSKKILPTMAIASSVLTLLAAAQLFGFGPANMINQATGLQLPTTVAISLASSPFVALQVIGLTIAGLIISIVTNKHVSKVAAITLPVLLIGAGIHVWSLLPGKPAEIRLPSWEASWSVALDTIRTPRAALIGAGPESYANVYTRFKPAWVNLTDNWAITFPQAANVPLTLLTISGFIGLIAWLVIVYISFKAMKTVKTAEAKTLSTLLFASFIMQFFIPGNMIIFALQMILIIGVIVSERAHYGVLKFQALAVSIENKISEAMPPVSRTTSLPVFISSGILLIAVLFGFYFAGTAYSASIASFQASKALANNEVTKAYDLQRRVIFLNPYLDTYHRQYAATNMLIAQALAQNAEATEEQQQQAGQLLQQAVREAQTSTVLDPLDAQNWAVLAQIYENMIGAVEEADQWAVQAYVEAAQADPTNPNIRISVGGIFLGQEQYQQALSLFLQAQELQPNLPNAYYNAAFAYKQLGAYAQAKANYEVLLNQSNNLLDPASEDYQTVVQELAEVEELLAEQAEATESAQVEQTTPSLTEQNIQQGDQVTTPEEDVQLDDSTPLGQEIQGSNQEGEANADGTEGETNTQEGNEQTEPSPQP